MTYPGLVKPRSGWRIGRGASDGLDGAHANPRNLRGFLDAFKAVRDVPGTSFGATRPVIDALRRFRLIILFLVHRIAVS